MIDKLITFLRALSLRVYKSLFPSARRLYLPFSHCALAVVQKYEAPREYQEAFLRIATYSPFLKKGCDSAI